MYKVQVAIERLFEPKDLTRDVIKFNFSMNIQTISDEDNCFKIHTYIFLSHIKASLIDS